MGTNRTNFVLGIVVLAVSGAGAQQTSLQIFQRQGIGQDKVLQVTVKTGKNDEWFTPANPPAGNLCNYNLYEVQHPDDPRMKITDLTGTYLAYPQGGCGAVPVQLPASGDAETPYQLSLQTPLKFGVRYLLTIRNPADLNPDNNLVVTVFTGSASLLLEPQLRENRQLMVSSTVWLKAAKGDAVIFKNKSDKPGQSDTDLHGVVATVTTAGVIVTLTDKLPADRTGALQLTSQGLFDGYKNDIHAAGKVTPTVVNTASSTAGQPPSITSAMVTAQFSATAAVHSTPTLSATGALAPWNQVIHMKDVSRGNAVYFDPVVNFDVGTTNSKSANSVILPSPFTHDFTLTGNQRADLAARNNCLTASSQDCNDSALAKEKSVSYSSLNASFGPREEFDTLHGGTNLLGEVRLDLYPSFWYHTAASQKAALAAGNPAIRDLLQMPDGGWSIAPYLQYDGGGHVTAQTITNSGKNPAAIIPTYDISRLYLGLVFAGTYKSSSVNIDGSWFDLFTQETVPTIISKVTYAKTFAGWQPHIKGTYSFSLDRTKHYLLSFSWEDGRSAPSFGYGNKATGGLQVVY
jgi:hypothetical protein